VSPEFPIPQHESSKEFPVLFKINSEILVKEEPVKEEPVKEEPVKEEPVKEEPVKEESPEEPEPLKKKTSWSDLIDTPESVKALPNENIFKKKMDLIKLITNKENISEEQYEAVQKIFA
jgi:hypothetical protein